MLGLGGQEILLLGILFAVPAVIVVFVLFNRSKKDKDEE